LRVADFCRPGLVGVEDGVHQDGNEPKTDFETRGQTAIGGGKPIRINPLSKPDAPARRPCHPDAVAIRIAIAGSANIRRLAIANTLSNTRKPIDLRDPSPPIRFGTAIAVYKNGSIGK
jgi:hypothetical protein